MGIKLSDLMEIIDEDCIDILIKNENLNTDPTQTKSVKEIVMMNIIPTPKKRISIMTSFQLGLIIVLSLSLCTIAFAAIQYYKLTKAEPITDENNHLVGKEYIDSDNENVTILNADELADFIEQGKIMTIDNTKIQSKIISSIEDFENPPSSITDIKTTQENGYYIAPELIMPNGSMVIFTREDGSGWELNKEESIKIVFEKYQHEIINEPLILFGFIKNNQICTDNELTEFKELSGEFSITSNEDNTEYYFYVIAASSDPVAVKKCIIRVLQ